ncbi:MAG: DUF378 domain-containing protein [Candidatus Peregrinibacteria bacterium]
MKKLNFLDWVALILVVIGAINWGLVGLFQFDLVFYLFATMYTVAQVVYVVVGVAGLYLFVSMLAKGKE